MDIAITQFLGKLLLGSDPCLAGTSEDSGKKTYGSWRFLPYLKKGQLPF